VRGASRRKRYRSAAHLRSKGQCRLIRETEAHLRTGQLHAPGVDGLREGALITPDSQSVSGAGVNICRVVHEAVCGRLFPSYLRRARPTMMSRPPM
jgi:hypothetical protein